MVDLGVILGSAESQVLGSTAQVTLFCDVVDILYLPSSPDVGRSRVIVGVLCWGSGLLLLGPSVW